MASEPSRRRRFVTEVGDDGGEFFDYFDAMQEKNDTDMARGVSENLNAMLTFVCLRLGLARSRD